MKNEKKECWLCHRTLVGKQKLGLCPDCTNKGGTALAGAILFFGLKEGGKLVIKGIKNIKS